VKSSCPPSRVKDKPYLLIGLGTANILLSATKPAKEILV